MKKLIIKESQYSRLFSKRKKLVITESQYNKLLAEDNMGNSIKKIAKGDVIKIKNQKGETLHFKVIDAFNGQVLMMNCNDGVYKNFYFFFTGSDFSSSTLAYKKEHKKRIDPNKPKTEQVKTWKQSSFKNIELIAVYADDSGETCQINPSAPLKFTINTETGEPVSKNKVDDNDKGEPKVVEGTEELVDEILTQKLDTKYAYHLNGKGVVYMKPIQKGGNSIGFQVLSVEGDEGKKYDYLVGEYLEFEGNALNISLKVEPKYIFNLKLKRYTGGQDSEGEGSNSETVIIHDISDTELASAIPIEDEDEDEGTRFNYAELKDRMKDDKILKNLIQTTPSIGLELFGFVRKRGVIPSSEILSKWGIGVRNGDIKLMGGNFKADKNVLVEYTDTISNKNEKHVSLVNEFISNVRNVNYKDTLKVSRFYAGQKFITLKGKLDGEKYILRVKSSSKTKSKNEKDNNKYVVDIVIIDKKSEKPIKLGTTEINVINYNF